MPRINMICKNCNKKYTAGDLVPPSKCKCPKCKTQGNSPDYKKENLKCEICGTKVKTVDDLTEYDGLLVDHGYDCCEYCTNILEGVIKDTISRIRDKKLINK